MFRRLQIPFTLLGLLAVLPSCALIGKAQRQEIDRRNNGSHESLDEVWSERFSVTGKAHSAPDSRGSHYVIRSDWRTLRENPWFSWPEGHPERVLDSDVRYRFELIEHFRHMRDSFSERQYQHVEVERIQTLNGVTILDASICPIHSQHMRWDWETTYSREDFASSPYFKWRDKRFPHDGNIHLACGSGYYRQKRWICTQCKAAGDQAVKRLGITRY